MNPVLRIGLTGGIASGKSTIAGMFSALGVPVIDADETARRIVAPGEPALDEIIAAFGARFLDPRGALDRRRLREHIFSNDADRRRLELILHPRIESAMLADSARAGGPYQIMVVPLLIESGFDRHVDRILVVDCSQAVQRLRLLERDAEQPQRISRMLAAQLDREERLKRAHDVISNEAGLADAQAQVKRLHALYLNLARQKNP